MSRLPTVGGDNAAWGTVLNDLLDNGFSSDGILLAQKVIVLTAAPYNVSVSASAASNAAAIQTAFADAALYGGAVYLPGNSSMYPCNPLTLPRAPITFFGDGPTASVLINVAGGPALPMLSSDPLGLPASGPFTSVVNPGRIYDGNLTIIRDIGFNGYPNWTSGVKGISILNQAFPRAQFLLERVMVHACWGTGIELKNSGNLWGNLIQSCMVSGVGGICYDLGSDMMVRDCIAAGGAWEGFYSDGGTSLQIVNCKAFGTGYALASRGIGFYVKQVNAGVSIVGCNAQDCKGEGLVIETAAHNVVVDGFVADSNSAGAAGTYSGMRLSDCKGVKVVGYLATDRFYNNTSFQTHGLKVTNPNGTNEGNFVEMAQTPTDEGRGFPTLSDPIDQTSDLLGTHVQVGASSGGQQNLTVSAGVVAAIDPYKARVKQIPVAANITSIPAPTNKHRGCRLNLQFNASGAFNVTGGWNAIYKGTAAIPTTGGAAGKYMICEFEFDGTSWFLTNAPAWR